MSNTITRNDVIQHAISPGLEGHFSDATVEKIQDAVFEAAPLSTWTFDPITLQYSSSELSAEDFWALVERLGIEAGE